MLSQFMFFILLLVSSATKDVKYKYCEIKDNKTATFELLEDISKTNTSIKLIQYDVIYGCVYMVKQFEKPTSTPIEIKLNTLTKAADNKNKYIIDLSSVAEPNKIYDIHIASKGSDSVRTFFTLKHLIKTSGSSGKVKVEEEPSFKMVYDSKFYLKYSIFEFLENYPLHTIAILLSGMTITLFLSFIFSLIRRK